MIKIIDMRKGKDSGLFDKLVGRDRVGSKDVAGAVGEILTNVRENGDGAVLEYTKKFDRVVLNASSMKVSEQEVKTAYDAVDPKLVEVIRKSKANIAAFHEKQKENSWFTAGEDGILLGQLYRPLEKVGIYVPGGTAVLTSTVLMTAIPAKVAGVEKIIMATPPGSDGKIDPQCL